MSQFFRLYLIFNLLGLPLIIDSVMRFILVGLRFRVIPPVSLAPLASLGGETGSRRGLVVLIAARDEAGTIGATVESMRPLLQEVPGSRLWVVADHCADGTASEAGAAGALVAERREGPGGKGAVIRWWLESYREEWAGRKDCAGPAAIVIADADSRLKSGSLRALGAAIDQGADAAQAFVAPLASTATGRLAGWSEVLMQQIDDRARAARRWPVPLRGTGMAIRPALLAELAPLLHTQAEDLELDILLALRDARVDFVPTAVINDPKPTQAAGASRQRARWLKGQVDVLRDYLPDLPRLLARGRVRGPLGDLFLLVPLFWRPKLLLIALRVALWPVFPLVATIGLLLDLLYYLAGALFVDHPRQYLRDLLGVPLYLLVWGQSLILALLHRGRAVWLRAGRS